MTDPLFVALTVDVDPDASRAVAGRTEAVTAGAGGGVRTEGCVRGMHLLAGVLGRLGIPCTFFWDARTLRQFRQSAPAVLKALSGEDRFEHGSHGLRHEDFSGAASGKPLNATETMAVLEKASEVHRSVFGRRPSGFRAPYCRLTDELVEALHRLGYRYDASLTRRAAHSRALHPFPLRQEGGQTLWEIPLCRWKEGEGRPISGYLWQLFEGRRRAQSYIGLAGALRERCPGGLLQIALHPWHLCVLADGRALARADCQRNAGKLASVIEGIQRLGDVRLCGLAGYLAERVRTNALGG